jgi:predicted membrane-bound mannosyltransferase/DNA-binding beta-propeller fold protein YncE
MSTQEQDLPYGGTTAQRFRAFAAGDETRDRVSALAARYWEAAAYGILVIAAAILRFYDLGSRAIHHDESLHAFYAFQFAEGLGNVFTFGTDNFEPSTGYSHVPFMHGPFQFIASGFFQWIFGDGDYQARILAAVMGTGLVLLPIFLRKQLGVAGALCAATLITISPTLLYYSRFTREDIYTAFWTLGIVAFAWKYIETQREDETTLAGVITRRHAWLFLAVGCMAGSFLTKETTHLTVIGFLLIFDVLLARNFADQIRAARPQMTTERDIGITLLLVPIAWLIALTWPFTLERRERWGLLAWPAEADVLVVMGTIALPLYAALTQEIPGASLIMQDHGANANSCAGQTWKECVGSANSHVASSERTLAYTLMFGLMGLSAVAGVLWQPRVWLAAAACFWAPYILFSTTFFTNIDGFSSVLWGSVDYWVSQQYERRGDQPDYYYFVTIPTYEFVPLALAAIGGVYYLIRGNLARALIFAGVFGIVIAMLAIPGSDPALLKCDDGQVGEGGAEPVCKLSAEVGTSLFHIILPFTLVLIAVLAFPLDRFTRFVMGWLVFTTFYLTVAGEKMPWLNVHIALPLIILASKFVGDMLRNSDLRDDLPALERVAPYVYAAVASALAVLIFTLVGPFAPASIGAWALVAVAVVAVYWSFNEYSRRTAAQVALVAAIAAFSVFSARSAVLASWGHPDSPYVGQPGDVATRDYGEVPIELLVYTQTSGDIPALRDRIAQHARESGQGFKQPIVVDGEDGFTWPWAWYLRDYPVSYASFTPEYEPPEGAILLVHDSNASGLRLPGYEPGIRYHHRRWFHEEYRGHAGSNVWSTHNFFSDIVSAHQWKFWLDYWLRKDPPFDEPGTVDGMAFFPAGAGTFSLEPESPTVRMEGAHTVIGGRGYAKGQLESPSDVAIDGAGNLYVADTNNDRIEKYDAAGNFLAYAGGFQSDIEMTQPWSLAVGDDGSVFVANTWAHTVIKLDTDLQVVETWGAGGQVEPGGDPFALYGPRDIAVAPNGNLMLTDTGNARVVEYTPDGDFVRQFGSKGKSGAPLEFDEPTGIDVSATGEIYIADLFNSRIVVLNNDLSLKLTIAVAEWDSQGTSDKAYITVLPDGRVLATDPADDVVIVFGADGAKISEFEMPNEGTKSFARPVGVATDGTSVWVSDSEGHVVRKMPLSEVAP